MHFQTESATQLLSTAFLRRVVEPSQGVPVIGHFGDDLPLHVVRAFGAVPSCIKLAPEDEDLQASAIEGLLEPFMDDFARQFLLRFAAGHLDGMAGLVFSRDDAAAFTAYQYATEFRRQGIAGRQAPPLHLWNFLHSDTVPVAAFNRVQLQRLQDFLMVVSGTRQPRLAGDGDELQQAALDRLQALQAESPCRISGREALVWRNAGRWLSPEVHAKALEAAFQGAVQPGHVARIALVGSATCSLPFYETIEQCGTVVCDLQPFGRYRASAEQNDEAWLLAEARDDLHPRGVPAERYRPALLKHIVDARCDLVISQVDRNDDTFGWEVPALSKALKARGIRFVDLGFRPMRPDDQWLAAAAARIAGVVAS